MSGNGERGLQVVFLDRATLPDDIRVRSLAFPHQIQEYDRSQPHDVAGRIADADIVIVNKAEISAESIASAPRLKLIAVAATGTDIVDLAACRERGIVVSNIRNYAIHTVPEHTFALILALRRSILAYRDSVHAGAWERAAQFCFFDHPIRDL